MHSILQLPGPKKGREHISVKTVSWKNCLQTPETGWCPGTNFTRLISLNTLIQGDTLTQTL